MEAEIDHNPSIGEDREFNKAIEPALELKSRDPVDSETNVQERIVELRRSIRFNVGDATNQNNDAIEIIEDSRRSILTNTTVLDKIKGEYGLRDWSIHIDPKFSVKPSRVSWEEKTVTIRPFNLWSYLSAGGSIEKRNKVLPKLLAHELRHAQQKPPDNSLKGQVGSFLYAYWFHPLEVDARRWAAEHEEKFRKIIVVASK